MVLVDVSSSTDLSGSIFSDLLGLMILNLLLFSLDFYFLSISSLWLKLVAVLAGCDYF
jgi:hypothetical protein